MLRNNNYVFVPIFVIKMKEKMRYYGINLMECVASFWIPAKNLPE